jgi:hypothetical protein
VELEKNTPWVQMLDVVAAVVVPNVDARANPELPPVPVPQAAAEAERVPSGPTCTQRVPVPPALERMKLVVDAVVAVIAVVDALLKVWSAVKVFAKYVLAIVLDASTKNIAEVVAKKLLASFQKSDDEVLKKLRCVAK